MKNLELNNNAMNYSINDTNIAKGIATILLLNHHLFLLKVNAPPMINGFSIVNFCACVSKVCVAIFVFLSGYGLSKSWKDESVFIFLKKRLLKIFLNYWFIWIVFVSIDVFIFGRTFSSVYGDHVFSKFIINIFGLQTYFGFYGFNPTWWFISLVIALYFIFPFLKLLVDKYKFLGVSLTVPFLIMELKAPVIQVSFILPWLFPFALGIYSANESLLSSAKIVLSVTKKQKLLKFLMLLIVIGMLILFRQFGYILTGIRIDGLLAFCIIAFAFLFIRTNSFIGKSLSLIGVHSFNIFLFHTFIFKYYFPSFFLNDKISIGLLLPLLFVCLFISVMLELIKKKLRFYEFERKLTECNFLYPTA